MSIDVVPYAGLKDRVQAEAMLSLDFSTIYVDNYSYMSDKHWNRLKFSLAHELGHFALHREFFERQNIVSEETWISFMEAIQLKYGFLENHANWFAGALLVPTKELLKCFKNKRLPTISSLSRKFEVSTMVIEKRLLSEDIAPYLNL